MVVSAPQTDVYRGRRETRDLHSMDSEPAVDLRPLCRPRHSLLITFGPRLQGKVAGEIAIDSFAIDKSIRAFVSTDAGALGTNLHSARYVVNFEPAWNPSTNAQRIQRVHRIGQTREVKAVYLLTPLDQIFVLSTHGRKNFSPDRIDARMSPGQSSLPLWEELLPVIDCFRLLARKGVRENEVMSRWIASPRKGPKPKN